MWATVNLEIFNLQSIDSVIKMHRCSKKRYSIMEVNEVMLRVGSGAIEAGDGEGACKRLCTRRRYHL